MMQEDAKDIQPATSQQEDAEPVTPAETEELQTAFNGFKQALEDYVKTLTTRRNLCIEADDHDGKSAPFQPSTEAYFIGLNLCLDIQEQVEALLLDDNTHAKRILKGLNYKEKLPEFTKNIKDFTEDAQDRTYTTLDPINIGNNDETEAIETNNAYKQRNEPTKETDDETAYRAIVFLFNQLLQRAIKEHWYYSANVSQQRNSSHHAKIEARIRIIRVIKEILTNDPKKETYGKILKTLHIRLGRIILQQSFGAKTLMASYPEYWWRGEAEENITKIETILQEDPSFYKEYEGGPIYAEGSCLTSLYTLFTEPKTFEMSLAWMFKITRYAHTVYDLADENQLKTSIEGAAAIELTDMYSQNSEGTAAIEASDMDNPNKETTENNIRITLT